MVHFIIRNENEMCDVCSQLTESVTYDSLWFEIENVTLLPFFYEKLAILTTNKLSFDINFTGNLDHCMALPNHITELYINSPEEIGEVAIRTISNLIELETLTILKTSFSTNNIDKILSRCRKLTHIHISYPYIDIYEPTHSHENVKEFVACHIEEGIINMHAWFPNLCKLSLYVGDTFNVAGLDKLLRLEKLNLKYLKYEEKYAKQIDRIYPQLICANIMIDNPNKCRISTERKGSVRWPLKYLESEDF